MWYQTWAEPLFYPEQVRSLLREGLIPMINWQPTAAHGEGRYSLTAIADGAFDSYIRRSARAAARWGHPMFIDFAHEMNIGGTAWSPGVEGNTPGAYVRAWRHVVRIFRAAGADRVRWLWAPNVDCGGACPFSQFYPGDAWVNWVGLDGYNSGAGSKSRWTEFEEEFGPSYEALTRLTGKPVMIAETASSEAGGDKATWILNMARALETRFTRVRALVWFDRQKEHDWRINSSSASLAAFQQAMKMPPFSQAAQ
jgi:beta-mannanase